MKREKPRDYAAELEAMAKAAGGYQWIPSVFPNGFKIP